MLPVMSGSIVGGAAGHASSKDIPLVYGSITRVTSHGVSSRRLVA